MYVLSGPTSGRCVMHVGLRAIVQLADAMGESDTANRQPYQVIHPFQAEGTLRAINWGLLRGKSYTT